MSQIDVVWLRIEQSAGGSFHLSRGGDSTYRVASGQVRPDRTNQVIPRSQFEKALDRIPLTSTAQVQDLRGPSYIFAMLTDPRIRQSDW